MTSEATTVDPAPTDASGSPGLQGAIRGRLELAASQLLVGTTVISAAYMAKAFPVFVGMAIRQTVALMLLVIIFRVLRLQLPKLTRRDHGIVLLQTITGVVLFNGFLMLGVERTTAAASGVITATLPAMIAVLSLALGERISRLTVYGIMVAMVGLVIVNLPGDAATSSQAPAPLLGGGLVMAAVVCEALFTIIGKSLVHKVTPLQNCLLLCAYGSAMLLPLAIWQLPNASFADAPLSGWLAIIWSAGPVMVGATSLWFGGLKFIPASAAAVYTGLIPVSAVLLSFALLGEAISWKHVIGMALVILAVVLVARPRRTPQLAAVS